MNAPDPTINRFDEQWLSFDDFLKATLQHVISADLQMQLTQGIAWQRLSEPLRVQGIDVAEGTLDFRNLAITELNLNFWLEPSGMSGFSRLLNTIRVVFGYSPNARKFRIVAPGKSARAIGVTVSVGRRADGEWKVTSESPAQTLSSNAYVPRILT